MPSQSKKAAAGRKSAPQLPPAPLDGAAGYFSAQLSTEKRDLTGFPTDDQPGLDRQQILWLVERLDAESDEHACECSGFDPHIVRLWKQQPQFLAVYHQALSNKREAFKYLCTQLLPQVLRTLILDLEDPSGRTRQNAVTLLLRTNGLLVDKVQRSDPDAVLRLMDMLRQKSPTAILDVKPRE